MAEPLKVDLCVIGAGSGGLSVAAGAVQMGASVALIEEGEMGGDCLNYGCVPSKALLAAAKHAHAFRTGAPFGVAAAEPRIDFAAVMAHIREVIAGIAPHDSQERFEGLGVTVIRAHGRFIGADRVEAGGREIRARRFVVATGSRPLVPPIPGVDETPYLTNETIFENTVLPEHLIVIGGGPIGIEMAQAHARLGARATVIEAATALGKDDPECVAVALAALREEGVEILERAKATKLSGREGAVAVTVEGEGGPREITGSHLLMAAGRAANVERLGLDVAGVAHDRRGIKVDAGLRTANRKIYAIGDCAGGLQFTHVAGAHASIVIRSALFRLPAKFDAGAVPWVTYSDPELAQVGLTEAQAREAHGDAIEVLRAPFAENDRARAELRTEGLLKAVTRKNGRVLGCSIVGPQAGELILPWVQAVASGAKVKSLATLIAPYPTLSEATKRAAGSYFAPKLFSERTRGIVRFLSWFG